MRVRACAAQVRNYRKTKLSGDAGFQDPSAVSAALRWEGALLG